MKALRRALMSLLVVGLAFAGSDAGAKVPQRLWEVDELARLMRADMAEAGRDGLAQLVSTLGQRLILTTETLGIEQIGDVELLMRLATGVQMLTEVSEASPNLLQVERATAFALYSLGRRYEKEDDFRFAIDSLEANPQGGALLMRSVKAMKAYGASWFLSVVARLEKGAPLDNESNHQLGRIELDEGRFADAAQRLSGVFAKAPDRELAKTMCEALLGVAEPAVERRVQSLRDSVKDRLPALADELAVCLERHADEVATKDFERRANDNTVTPDEVAPQVERYQRLDKPGAAENLARLFMRAEPAKGAVTAAELFFKLRRWESLRTLFAEARAEGRMDPRLRELEVLVNAAMDVQASLGAAVAVEGDVVRELMDSTLPPLVKRGQKVMVRLARWLGSADGDRGAAQKALDSAVAEVLKEHGGEVAGLGVVLIAKVGNDKLDEGLALIKPKVNALRKRVAKLGPEQRAELATFESLLARVDLGMGLRQWDDKRVKRALAAMAKVMRADGALSGAAKAELVVADVVGRLASEVYGGRLKPGAVVDAARSELARLEWDLSRTTLGGRLVLQARALTLGTLAQLAGQGEAAMMRWSEARASQSGAMAFVAGGLAQSLIGDVYGAAALCGRAGEDERPAISQWLAACAAMGQEGEEAKASWKRVLDLWDAAIGAPNKKGAARMGVARPLFYGTFDIGVQVAHGEPFALILDARPVVALVPELVPERAAVEAITQ